MTDVELLSGLERLILLRALQSLEGDEPSDATFTALLQLSTGGKSKKIFIRQPKILPLILSLFWNPSRLLEHLQVFEFLCVHSPANCIRAHEGQLDLKLLEFIQFRANEFQIRPAVSLFRADRFCCFFHSGCHRVSSLH